jgi:hypothetical protein
MSDVVYITSASFSGSTLLTFLLNTHPKIATIGEMKGDSMDVERYRCSCREPIGRCQFWQRLVARIRQHGVPFDLSDVWSQSGFRIREAALANRIVRHRHRSRLLELCRDAFTALSPACRRAFPRIVRTNTIFVQAVTELTGRSIFVDCSKDAVRLKYLRRIPSFRTKVIYMVRDGRGVMHSSMQHFNMSPGLAAREWLTAQREIACALRAVAQSSQLLIRYEDLCTNPTAVMARVFRFVGVSPEDAALDFRAVEHHILGNAMRLNDRSEIRLDVRWLDDLSPGELAVFEHIGGRWNRKLGYSRARSSAPSHYAVEGSFPGGRGTERCTERRGTESGS